MTGNETTDDQLIEVWERHMAAEFATKSVADTMVTMSADPSVNHVPVMTGGVGTTAVRDFYTRYFLTGHPADTAVELVSRTVGDNRIVDEMIFRFTHDLEMTWMLPGVAPTGRPVEVPLVAIVQFEAGKVSAERIYWDQASVLAQIGLLSTENLPIAGNETSKKVLDPSSVPSNQLIHRAESGNR
jgi:carboxymethylenebutenolidase